MVDRILKGRNRLKIKNKHPYDGRSSFIYANFNFNFGMDLALERNSFMESSQKSS